MALPLSPLASSALNLKSPPALQRGSIWHTSTEQDAVSYKYTGGGIGDQTLNEDNLDDPPSSPFVPEPRKSRSPTKHQSPTKPQAKKHPQQTICEDGVLRRESEGIMGDDSIVHCCADDESTSVSILGQSGYAGMDDTAFSTFSAVPNADMTLFARLVEHDDTGESPAKQLRAESVARYYDQHGNTPDRRGVPSTPKMERHEHDINRSPTPSPTPRGQYGSAGDGNTTNLLDFTETFNAVSRYSSQGSPNRRSRNSPKKLQSQSDLAAYFTRSRGPSPGKNIFLPSTPSEPRHLASLLDFDIPPAPTPRSVPSITPRELESLKSSYLSQISSLKASLSGKEAEVGSLKEAVGDAERRVGEALETIREERGLREQLQAEQRDWEKRGKEMEVVLRSIKDEIIRGEREKEEIAQRLEESERKREEAETKAAEAESRVAGMRVGSTSTLPGSETGGSEASGSTTKEVEAAVEKVARELHSLYKSKHETKVAALKKSYEMKWDKKVKELEKKLDEAGKEIDELRIGRDATMSGVVVAQVTTTEERDNRAEEAQKAEEQKAKLAGLAKELESVKRDNRHLLQELERERVEKGELVAAVDEMLLLSSTVTSEDSASSGLESLRGSISKASGASMMRSIGFNPSSSFGASGESRIGKVGSGSTGLSRSRSGSAMGSRSGVMSGIERMGRGRID
ncbi:hypothetical protein GP486_002632 [Trichoglossum hirsutum]|uniref:Uncharacterized protein n=1 Tax=Trichoglossum hirsutum TaxID=265104 RepID=A0A9P8RRI8_9PEZI|nr:hypothetical protein GP486_002632 [Trichoglossum hirsutum]